MLSLPLHCSSPYIGWLYALTVALLVCRCATIFRYAFTCATGSRRASPRLSVAAGHLARVRLHTTPLDTARTPWRACRRTADRVCSHLPTAARTYRVCWPVYLTAHCNHTRFLLSDLASWCSCLRLPSYTRFTALAVRAHMLLPPAVLLPQRRDTALCARTCRSPVTHTARLRTAPSSPEHAAYAPPAPGSSPLDSPWHGFLAFYLTRTRAARVDVWFRAVTVLLRY